MTKFKGKNSIKEASSLFIQREIFKQEAYDSISNTLKNSTVRDFNFADYSLYGRVDLDGVLKIPTNSSLQQIRTESGEESVRVVNFVAHAFTDFKNFFDKKLGSGKIPHDEDYIFKIDAVRGYRDPLADYYDYVINFINESQTLISFYI